MNAPASKLSFSIAARRVDAHGSVASCKAASISLDTDLAGNTSAFNPAELLLAALAACIIKGIERSAPMLGFRFTGVTVTVHGVRQDVPPRLELVTYDIAIDSDESNERLALLHKNVQKFGTVFNTIAPGTELRGVLRRSGNAA